jgi:thiamine-phosphate pyrophosphorylase
VNDRAHVALISGAVGVHLRSAGMPARRVRLVVGPAAHIGRSVHDLDELAPNEMEDVDYVSFGTVFQSASKPPGHPVAGLARLARCCARAGRPVMAVGGISVARCNDVAATGAAGVAAIGLFADAWRRGGTALSDVVARVHDAWARSEAGR